MKKYSNPPQSEWATLTQRPTQTYAEIQQTVSTIFKEIETKGDKAVAKYTALFDGITLRDFIVSEEEITEATKRVSLDLQAAIALAKTNIEVFHAAQKTNTKVVETTNGVKCWQEKRAIQRVGLYIPGGSAPLFSTVLMLAIPAQIAGCETITLCTPPDKNGKIHPAILYAAKLCGVTNIYKIGGIQAIAAMTFGTATVAKVSKIFGPGNQYVTVAKQVATQFGVAIDMPAGPSELLVYADDSAIPAFVASDLLSQVEHGVDSQVMFVSNSQKLIQEVTDEISIQIQDLPRKEIAQKAIENSKILFMESDKSALDFINDYAPEHLIICAKKEAYFVNGIQNAGSVFVGNYTPESAGDYASGTNHTLPTAGFAKNYSGVNLDSFLKAITFQKITAQGIKNIGEAVAVMAEAEGLQAHKNAVMLRLNTLQNE